jgi:hypothetical protein
MEEYQKVVEAQKLGLTYVPDFCCTLKENFARNRRK